MLHMLRAFRRIMYPTLRIVNDIIALFSGKIVIRLLRRIAGKYTGKGIGHFFK